MTKLFTLTLILASSIAYAHVTPGSTPNTYHVDQFGSMEPTKEEMCIDRGNRNLYEDSRSPKMHIPRASDCMYRVQY